MRHTFAPSTVVLSLLVSAGIAMAQPPSPIQVRTFTDADAVRPGTVARVAIEAQLDPGFHVNSNQPLDESLIATSISFDPPDGVTLDAIAWPDSFMFTVGQDDLAVFGEEFTIGAAFAVASDLPTGRHVVPGQLRYQACDDTMCYFPATAPVEFELHVVEATHDVVATHAETFAAMDFTAVDATADATRTSTAPAETDRVENDELLTRMDRFRVRGTTGGYLGRDDFIAFIERAEAGQAERGWFEGRGPLAILALILVGGLALNLTPCVLPMIPINLAIIGAGARAGSRARGFALGSAYGLAMALVYGGLGLIVILTAGTFGTINASPWFNLGIAVLFVALALAMFDVFQIDFSSLQARLNPGSATGNGSLLVAFGMGGVAALLAGACVAPVVIQVIVFSSNLYATGTAVALLLPFVLGVGMALPWPIAGAGLTLMPKPGFWMVRVKQAFGVFIMGTALYYGYLSYELFSQRWVDPEAVATSVQELLEEGWYASLDDGLAAAEAEGKPVLVDVWATWCKNCLTMDRTTLQDPAVRTALDDYVKIKFQAEDLSVQPARDVMERFEAFGLPTYAILYPASAGEETVTND